MMTILSRAAILACAVAVSVSAQQVENAKEAGRIQIRYSSFDPLSASPEVPAALTSTAQQQLRIVQFRGTPTDAGRSAITAAGGKIIGYLPSNAYVVRMTVAQADVVRAADVVRWVGAYHPAYRMDPALIAGNVIGNDELVRYNIVVADKRVDKPALGRKIKALGGRIDDEHQGGLLFSVTLSGPQLAQVVGLDEVLWIDRHTEIGYDMNNARVQGGGNYVESQVGYTGTGVNAHIYEGVEMGHPDFTGSVTAVNSNTSASSHGHCTAGIVFGNGASNSSVRGMAPDCGKFFTNSATTSRWQVFSDLVNVHNVSHTTASWGGGRTFFYTSTSADADDMIFDHDLAWTQSQSNAGNQDSRPEAWAKNVFSIGGVAHGNNSSASDDSWQAGGASIGPANDGRIKPTLTAYYDQIGTSDRSGSAGYSSANWYSNFGGTSGATPIVAGHNVLAIQMFTDEVLPGFGPFGNPMRVPGGTSHQNRPHFPTLKALQVVSANQYSFTSSSSDNRRQHQGWGFPDLANMWDRRQETFIVDETDVMTQGQVHSWGIAVSPGEPSLKACLNWSEPAANPSAAQHIINNMSLRVTSPSGTVYWGNHNLQNGVWSTSGGSEDNVNTIENVFIANPIAGNWNVEVLATSIVQDNHVETPAVDCDYGLVVVGGQGSQVQFAQFSQFGQGCSSSVVVPSPPCFSWNSAGPLQISAGTLEYAHRVSNTGQASITSFDFYTRSTGGTVVVPAKIYQGTVPGIAPLATTTMSITSTAGFHTATFASPVVVNGSFCIALELTAGNVLIGDQMVGSLNVVYTRPGPGVSWALDIVRAGWSVTCSPTYKVAELTNSGLPVIGTSYALDLDEALPVTFAVLASGLSDSVYSGGALPAPLPGAPGCDLLVDPVVLSAYVTSALGSSQGTISVPNSAGLVGVEVFHQWLVLDASANAIGLVTSNGGHAVIGN
jgi:serine protease AprX